jgi:hypothetical protein
LDKNDKISDYAVGIVLLPEIIWVQRFQILLVLESGISLLVCADPSPPSAFPYPKPGGSG